MILYALFFLVMPIISFIFWMIVFWLASIAAYLVVWLLTKFGMYIDITGMSLPIFLFFVIAAVTCATFRGIEGGWFFGILNGVIGVVTLLNTLNLWTVGEPI